ncbi:SDR family oxidoreductase [Tsuneonella sp. CC-YZS046]|uniref:SDR family NAD(P)-dependent oxidoreductase n=1 Tax=Tsuneonella sp. CC-YZS046 TaxID=3042152 RepID=UPI002D788D28|nr:SDR family oxidoreductase [Tsuneonella sp. CC-YZS046]WRO65326.1 SDR family oxidoreductase [Tsuneonella sp. CC-YZS046]
MSGFHQGCRRLEGKRAVVTGGGSGIGRGSALRFAAEGAEVLLIGRSEGNILETADMIRAAGGVAHHHVADVIDEEAVAGAAAYALDALGGYEILFANAGNTDHMAPLFEQTVEQWEYAWRGNVVSAFLTIKHFGPAMRDAGHGSIILMSSAGSLRANAGTIAYGCAKSAVNMLAMGAANAFRGTQVRVNAIASGLVETKLTKSAFDYARNKGVEHKMGGITPLRRTGTVGEAAGVAAFLASDDSAFITGQIIAADGGLSSTHPFGKVDL